MCVHGANSVYSLCDQLHQVLGRGLWVSDDLYSFTSFCPVICSLQIVTVCGTMRIACSGEPSLLVKTFSRDTAVPGGNDFCCIRNKICKVPGWPWSCLKPWVALNKSSWVHHSIAEIPVPYHHAWSRWCWESNLGLCAGEAWTLQTELPPLRFWNQLFYLQWPRPKAIWRM